MIRCNLFVRSKQGEEGPKISGQLPRCSLNFDTTSVHTCLKFILHTAMRFIRNDKKWPPYWWDSNVFEYRCLRRNFLIAYNLLEKEDMAAGMILRW